MIRMCDNCKRLGATLKSKHYGSVFNWCSLDCFDMYISKKSIKIPIRHGVEQ